LIHPVWLKTVPQQPLHVPNRETVPQQPLHVSNRAPR
jgi:hypothetical protein